MVSDIAIFARHPTIEAGAVRLCTSFGPADMFATVTPYGGNLQQVFSYSCCPCFCLEAFMIGSENASH